MNDRLENYVEVPERIRRFYDKYPDGRLVTDSYEFIRLEDLPDKASVGSSTKDVTQHYLVVKALAYRTADDPHPAVGLAQERFPGRTPYVFEAELQNGETSAWGRAIAATGLLEVGESIASANEVRSRQESAPADRPATDKQKEWLRPDGRKVKQHQISPEDYQLMLKVIGINSIDELMFNQVEPLLKMMEEGLIPGDGSSGVPADMDGLEQYGQPVSDVGGSAILGEPKEK